LKSVKRRDVTDEIDTMVKFLDKSKDELIQGIKEQNSIRNQPQKKTGQGKTDIPDYRELAKVPVSGLIKYGEGHTLEFKETLEYDIKQNQHNKNLNKECLRTIAAFLNTDGGILLIGVKDNGKVTGIKRDLQYVQRKNLDGFELKLRNLIRDRFTPLPFNGVRIKFEKLVTETICRIVVNPVNRDQIIHLDKEVYIRDGNTTRKLVGRDLTDWIQQRVQASDMGNSN
jgi:predicted HTH transcriptional regulator